MQKLEVLEEKQDAIVSDVAKIKSALIKRTDLEGSQQLFEAKLYETAAEFDAFGEKLNSDKAFQELFVSKM